MGVRGSGCFAKVGLGSIAVLVGSTINHDSQKAEKW